MLNEYLYNLKFRIANRMSGFPGFYTMISKNLTGRDCYTTKDTDIVIDGYPRSANTYATFAFQIAQKTPVIVANHIHKKSQFLLAEKFNIPGILLIRNPLDCLSSLLVRQPRYNPAALLEGYYYLYNGLRNSEAFVVGEFNDITNNYAEVIKRVNAKFGKNFDLFYNTTENEKAVKNIIEEQDKEKYASEYDQSVAYPNEKRKKAASDVKSHLLAPRYKKEYFKCQEVYSHFITKKACN